ncbi:MAG: hypothetical protein L3K26_18020, partial [Candidatus Hydrogenedentes bacterium]|nr:hypothetical protein [Candidatus Hydrogenedentota bacterium]
MKIIKPLFPAAFAFLWACMGLTESARAATLPLVEITPNQSIGTDPANFLPGPGYSPIKLPGIHQQAITAHEQGVNVWKSLAPGFVNVPVNIVLRGDTITLGIDIGGLMQSTDAGATWRNISYGVEGGFNTQHVVDFDVSPTNNGLMVVGGRGGIYRTEDGGTHWEHITQGLPRVQFLNWSIWYGQTKFNADGSRVFAAIGIVAVVAALLPMLFVSGLMGPYLSPIPANASAAMIFSFFVAVIITPWLMMKVAGNAE